ncbi:hypothetical protein [Saccharothrix deserti]|uniref:hypothetical protein n=1 Tax=Saccharothrix deserti TaxID=2593674 RepID=UPI001EE4955A|nr:hypothetical protein [Saccharothrix deserti]
MCGTQAVRHAVVVHHVQRGAEETRVQGRRLPGQHGQRAAVRALGQLDHVSIAQAGRGFQLTGGQVQEVESGRVGAFAPHPRVVAFGRASGVLLGRLVVRDHGDPTGQRQVVDDGSAPGGQLLDHAVVQADAAQLRVAALRRVRQVVDGGRVR